jgi:hypothetical protein
MSYEEEDTCHMTVTQPTGQSLLWMRVCGHPFLWRVCGHPFRMCSRRGATKASAWLTKRMCSIKENVFYPRHLHG